MLIALLSGCSTTASLFPVDGPLAKLSPPPVLSATADGITGGTGNISLVMPDGERCKGRWSSIAPMSYRRTTGSAAGTATDGLNSVWTSVYGSSFSVGNVPGVNKGEAMLIGYSGTVMQMEFFTGSGTANGTGVAKDNRGNTYKVLLKGALRVAAYPHNSDKEVRCISHALSLWP